ncbi:annexin-B12 [Anabrus simplex]|uniref:annexin-B12 n=1 Tax=Anabrus simplex TaxID=316456 RepID=UPI0035A30B6B
MRVTFGRLLSVAMPTKNRSPSVDISSSSSLGFHQNVKNNGTVRPTSNFSGEEVAKRMHAAFHREMNTDIATIMEILTTHSNKQRQSIKRHYKLLHDKALEVDVFDHLGGNFRDLSLMLLQSPIEFLAEQIHIAIQQVGPEETTMVELLCNCNNAKIKNIKEVYYKKYGRDLDSVVKQKPNSDFQRLSRLLLITDRDESPDVNLELARKDAEMLATAGVGVRYGMDDVVIASLLRQRSYAHLREMFEQYHIISGREIADSIRTDFSGGLRNGLIVLCKAIIDSTAFYATHIHEALIGPNPDDFKLLRLFVARSELDLADIKDAYLEIYGQKLTGDVSDNTSSGYRKYLLHLLGQHDN